MNGFVEASTIIASGVGEMLLAGSRGNNLHYVFPLKKNTRGKVVQIGPWRIGGLSQSFDITV